MTQDELDALKRIAQSAEYPVLKKYFHELIAEVTNTKKVNGADPLVVTAEVIGRNLVADLLTQAMEKLDSYTEEKREKNKVDKYE